MTLKERLEKLNQDIAKVDDKKKILVAQRKKVVEEIDQERQEKKAAENKKIVEFIEENFGPLEGEGLEAFQQLIKKEAATYSVEEEGRIGFPNE